MAPGCDVKIIDVFATGRLQTLELEKSDSAVKLCFMPSLVR